MSGQFTNQSEFENEQVSGPYDSDEFMAALYWDINCVANFRAIVFDPVDTEHFQYDFGLYQDLCEATKAFIGHVLGAGPGATPNTRMNQFLDACGWRMFAICIYSDAFRRAYFKLPEKDWADVVNMISMAQRSIDVFARLRQLDWRGPLLPWAQYDDAQKPQLPGQSPVLHLGGLRHALQPDIDIAREHPHHTVIIPQDSSLRRPRFGGKTQRHSDFRMFSENMRDAVQRNFNIARPSRCLLCYDRDPCFCRVTSKTGDLVELQEYGGKGVGVRSVTIIEKGDVIGEYIGQVEPPSLRGDTTPYSLAQGGEMKIVGSQRVPTTVGVIQSDAVGNWTRFINHSCEASCSFENVAVGNEWVTVVMAERRIAWGEEITVNYSPAYWGELGCPCGSANCVNPRSLGS